MVSYQSLEYLPSSEELPDSDDTPVDNELQNIIPNLLLSVLATIWLERTDWFFGVDMGIYHRHRHPAVIPDGFLSLGVDRLKTRPSGRQGRLSYVLWEENWIWPLLFLEVVSQKYNGEYKDKKTDYAQLGILYYVIYDCDSNHPRKGDRFEVYRLVNGKYVRQAGEPLWLPEIGLAIGREMGTYRGWTREWLYWYDANGNKYPTPEEQLQETSSQLEETSSQLEDTSSQLEETSSQLQETSSQLEEASQRLEYLNARLQELGINPDNL